MGRWFYKGFEFRRCNHLTPWWAADINIQTQIGKISNHYIAVTGRPLQKSKKGINRKKKHNINKIDGVESIQVVDSMVVRYSHHTRHLHKPHQYHIHGMCVRRLSAKPFLSF